MVIELLEPGAIRTARLEARGEAARQLLSFERRDVMARLGESQSGRQTKGSGPKDGDS